MPYGWVKHFAMANCLISVIRYSHELFVSHYLSLTRMFGSQRFDCWSVEDIPVARNFICKLSSSIVVGIFDSKKLLLLIDNF